MNPRANTLTNSSNFILLPSQFAQSNVQVQPVVTEQIRLRSKWLRYLSGINVLLAITSCSLHVGTIIAFNGGLFASNNSSEVDVIGFGIIAGFCYVLTGFCGFSASYTKNIKRIKHTLAGAILSALCSAEVAVFSGIMAFDLLNFHECKFTSIGIQDLNYECTVWTSLEISLVFVSILAFGINLGIIEITAKVVCSCCRRKQSPAGHGLNPAIPSHTMQFPVPPRQTYGVSPTYAGMQQQAVSPGLQLQYNYNPMVNPQLYPVYQQLQPPTVGRTQM